MSLGEKEHVFSEKERLFIADSDFLKTKKIITKKVERLLVETQQQLRPFVKETPLDLDEHLLIRSGKISRGENYQDLPYQVLDYPRFFSKESVFAFRAMFWWGNFFSCTLHLQGAILDKLRDRLNAMLPKYELNDTYFCVNSSPWDYHYQKSNYMPLSAISESDLKQFVAERNFIKLSRKLPLEEYRLLPKFALETLQVYYRLLQPLD